jgi:hypothetical protein
MCSCFNSSIYVRESTARPCYPLAPYTTKRLGSQLLRCHLQLTFTCLTQRHALAAPSHPPSPNHASSNTLALSCSWLNTSETERVWEAVNGPHELQLLQGIWLRICNKSRHLKGEMLDRLVQASTWMHCCCLPQASQVRELQCMSQAARLNLKSLWVCLPSGSWEHALAKVDWVFKTVGAHTKWLAIQSGKPYKVVIHTKWVFIQREDSYV